jgi:RNA polymerase sigma factor (sigma-70 family)
MEIAAGVQEEVVRQYEQHAASLLRYARSITRQSEVAREAVQETFLRYLVERRYGRVIQNPATWLRVVLRNYLLARLGAPEENAGAESRDLDSLHSHTGDPEVLVRRAEAARALTAKLSRRERQCLSLRLEGLDYTGIAQAMSIRQGTVGALMARIQNKLMRENASASANR